MEGGGVSLLKQNSRKKGVDEDILHRHIYPMHPRKDRRLLICVGAAFPPSTAAGNTLRSLISVIDTITLCNIPT